MFGYSGSGSARCIRNEAGTLSLGVSSLSLATPSDTRSFSRSLPRRERDFMFLLLRSRVSRGASVTDDAVIAIHRLV